VGEAVVGMRGASASLASARDDPTYLSEHVFFCIAEKVSSLLFPLNTSLLYILAVLEECHGQKMVDWKKDTDQQAL
jgi:hypothetical protein